VQRFFREAETHCLRALPDNSDLVEQLIAFLSLPDVVRAKKGYEARKACETHYNWDRTAKVWEDYFDSVEVRPLEKTWASPAKIHTPDENMPGNLSNEQFVRWGMTQVAGRPELVNSYTALRMVRDLNWGKSLPSMGGTYYNEASVLGVRQNFEDFNREKAMKVFTDLCNERNHWEERRSAK
jgi:hypothetical protein